MELKKNTHRKNSCLAHCVQWTGKNTDEILSLLNVGAMSAKLMPSTIQNPEEISVAHGKGNPSLRIPVMKTTFLLNWWVVCEENGHTRCLSPDDFADEFSPLS